MSAVRQGISSYRSNRADSGQLDRSKVAHQCDRDKEETHG